MNDTRIFTTSGEEITLAASEVERLRDQVGDALLHPGDEGYDAARALWNGMIDKRPALIVRCRGTADVISAVSFARQHQLLLAVRGGGHNVAGSAVCDGGLMIDLSHLTGIHVDPAARTARVQPGVTCGALDRETQAFGLATPCGVVSTTGLSGLTLGGGFGWLSRKYGLTSDNLLAVDVVTAEGQFVTADATTHPDLFWGIRGGGGNFGVVVSFTYQLYPIGPTVAAGIVFHPMERAVEVMRFYRDFTREAPDELAVLAVLRNAPPAPFLPSAIHGQPVIGIAACYAGPVEAGERALRPLKGFGAPIVDLIGPKPYRAHQAMLDTASPSGRQYYWKSEYLPEVGDGAIETMVQHAANLSSPLTAVLLYRLGGAIERVAETDTAAANRGAAYVINIQSSWLDAAESPEHIQWTRDFWMDMQPFSTGGAYVSFLGADEGQARVRAAYGANYDRLVALKDRYDPTNLFSLNQNIAPSSAAPRASADRAVAVAS